MRYMVVLVLLDRITDEVIRTMAIIVFPESMQ